MRFWNTEKIRKSMIRQDMFDARSEATYHAERMGLMYFMRQAGDAIGRGFQTGAAEIGEFFAVNIGGAFQGIVGSEVAGTIGAAAGAFSGSMAGLVGVGISAGLGASFLQLDYLHKKRNLRDLYRDEIAEFTHKSPRDVTLKDLECFAKSNDVLAEDLERARQRRNVGIPLAAIATIVSMAAVLLVLPALAGAMGLSLGSGIGMVTKLAVSMGSYMGTYKVLSMASERRFHLTRETANDRIADISLAQYKGKAISPELVLGALASAKPELAQEIEQQFGKKFDLLTPEQQEHAVLFSEKTVPVRAMADALTHGKMKATQLVHAGFEPPAVQAPVAVPQEAPSSLFARRFQKSGNIANFVARLQSEPADGISRE